MGTLLGLFGLSVHLIIEKVKNKTLRIVPVLFVIIIFLIIWAELAVGIFGSPFAGS
jgi:ABC-type microcin C transport system permease subunit YejE